MNNNAPDLHIGNNINKQVEDQDLHSRKLL